LFHSIPPFILLQADGQCPSLPRFRFMFPQKHITCGKAAIIIAKQHHLRKAQASLPPYSGFFAGIPALRG